MSVVRFNGSDVTYGGCSNPAGKLEAGKTYEVASVEVRDWHTRVALRDIPGSFNSVNFDDVDGVIDGAIEDARDDDARRC